VPDVKAPALDAKKMVTDVASSKCPTADVTVAEVLVVLRVPTSCVMRGMD
jgi:hypothetical protein